MRINTCMITVQCRYYTHSSHNLVFSFLPAVGQVVSTQMNEHWAIQQVIPRMMLGSRSQLQIPSTTTSMTRDMINKRIFHQVGKSRLMESKGTIGNRHDVRVHNRPIMKQTPSAAATIGSSFVTCLCTCKSRTSEDSMLQQEGSRFLGLTDKTTTLYFLICGIHAVLLSNTASLSINSR